MLIVRIVLFTILVVLSCNIRIPVYDQKPIITGKILLKEEADYKPLIGASIYKYGNIMNHTHSDIEGKFELTLENDTLLCVLSGFFNPIIFEVVPNIENKVLLNRSLLKKSERIWKSLKK